MWYYWVKYINIYINMYICFKIRWLFESASQRPETPARKCVCVCWKWEEKWKYRINDFLSRTTRTQTTLWGRPMFTYLFKNYKITNWNTLLSLKHLTICLHRGSLVSVWCVCVCVSFYSILTLSATWMLNTISITFWIHIVTVMCYIQQRVIILALKQQHC